MMADNGPVTTALRIMMVDDHQMFVDSIVRVFTDEPDFEVVGSTGNAANAETMVRDVMPDIVVLDYQLPDRDGVAVARSLRSLPNPPRIVMVTGYATPATVRAALEAGCTGVVAKHRAAGELVGAIRACARGESIAAVDDLAALMGGGAATYGLTARENGVLQRLALGESTETIATELFISRHTVRTHVQNLLSKLGAKSKLEAVAIARKQGLV